MVNLVQASRQWATRPPEERFTSLPLMQKSLELLRDNSRAAVFSSRQLSAIPNESTGLLIEGPGGHVAAPTHWAFGQLSNLSGAPAYYLRSLPAPLAADCLNYGFKVERDAVDTGILLTRDAEGVQLRAATGPRYGRIWNVDVVRALQERFGESVS